MLYHMHSQARLIAAVGLLFSYVQAVCSQNRTPASCAGLQSIVHACLYVTPESVRLVVHLASAVRAIRLVLPQYMHILLVSSRLSVLSSSAEQIQPCVRDSSKYAPQYTYAYLPP